MNSFSEVRVTVEGREQVRIPPGNSLVQRWQLFTRRLHTRRALVELSDAQLSDIGLSREQAQQEAKLPFWKL